MSCVRKRGNSWNAQVRVSGWRSFTKSFNKKTDALAWSLKLENQLKNTSLPEENINYTLPLICILIKLLL